MGIGKIHNRDNDLVEMVILKCIGKDTLGYQDPHGYMTDYLKIIL
jgi:hypothetical protein